VKLDGESALEWPGLTLQLAAFHIDAPEVTAIQEASIQQDLGPVWLKAGVLDRSRR
jgi:hypothetical protein